MKPQIFITGVSGYVGGQVLHALTEKHPEYEINGLVRDEAQGKQITAKYPSMKTVYGDLDSHDILVQAAKQADLVIQAAYCDHNPCVVSLIEGLSQGDKKGALLQFSGAASIVDACNGYGQPSTKVWDDVKDLEEILAFDQSRAHVMTDQLVLEEGEKHGIKTLIIVPPLIYGTGDGPIRVVSKQLPWLVEAAVTRGKMFTVGNGKHIMSCVHIKEVGNACVFMIEQALELNGGKLSWDSEGVYYVENGSFVFSDVTELIAKQMHEKGTIATAEIDHLSPEDSIKFHPWAPFIWGSNMRVFGARLRDLGWKGAVNVKTVAETVPELLQ